jgi:hypothetical protein
MRKLGVVIVLLVLIAAGVYVGAGFAAGPVVSIGKPEKFVGAATPLEVVVDAPGGRLTSLHIGVEQAGTRTPLVAWDGAGGLEALAPAATATVEGDKIRITRDVGKQSVASLTSGPAKIVVSASRPVLYGMRQVGAETSKDVEVRLERPRVSVLSTHHYINLGGSEVVVYRVAPDGVASGVRVGDTEYPGFPATRLGVPGIQISDPAVRVAFFSLLYDQDLNTPIRLFARDDAGNNAVANFDYRVFPKPAKQSQIRLDDKFLERVVPAILAGTTDVAPTGSTIEQFKVINGELRRKNAETIASYAPKTAAEMLWQGVVFHPFTNSAVESAFADRRTYFYQGKEVDRQVHLGFDLASYAGTPIVAANRGQVLFADELGIYGNCVIIDHGMGLQSLYAHLSSIDVAASTLVEKDQPIGKSGMTGLAGGDHLHFTMLVNGRMVNPVEWWDSHWIEDRILRKLRAASQ